MKKPPLPVGRRGCVSRATMATDTLSKYEDVAHGLTFAHEMGTCQNQGPSAGRTNGRAGGPGRCANCHDLSVAAEWIYSAALSSTGTAFTSATARFRPLATAMSAQPMRPRMRPTPIAICLLYTS